MERQIGMLFELCKKEGFAIQLTHKSEVSHTVELINNFKYKLSNNNLVITDLDKQNQYIFDLTKYIINSEDYLEYNSIYKIIMENSTIGEQIQLRVVD